MGFKERKAEREAKKLRAEASRYIEEAIERKPADPKAELLQFLIGLVLLAAGLFMICQHANIGTFGMTLRLFGIGIPNGLVTLPALVGVGMLFFCKRKLAAWIVLGLGTVFILLTIIMSLDITFPKTTLFNYIMMFGTTLAGAGLTLKALFGHR